MELDRLAALRDFFGSVKPRLPEIAGAMFSRLFAVAPETRSLFKPDMEDQTVRFAEMLHNIVELTRSKHLWPAGNTNGRTALPLLNELKSRHVQAGVTPQHFTIMEAALSQTCAELAPAEFTPKAAEALSFIFDVLARSLTVPDSAQEALARPHQAPDSDGAAPQDFASYFDGPPLAASTTQAGSAA